MITIRIANTGDAESISSLGKATFDVYYRHLFKNEEDIDAYMKNAFGVQKIYNSLVNKENQYWIAEDTISNIALGYAKLQLNASSELTKYCNVSKLQRIYVLPSFVSEGVGAKLEKLVVDKVKSIGNEYLWLSTLKSNKRTLKFYEREGYDIIGEDFFTIGSQTFEHWVYGKTLVKYPVKNY